MGRAKITFAKAWFETEAAAGRAFVPESGLMVLRNLAIRLDEQGTEPTPG